MQNYKGYNALDLILILLGNVVMLVASIIFKTEWLIIIHNVFCLFTVLTQAKGRIITQFLGILTSIFYVIIAYQRNLYGEAILYLFILLPMYIYGAVNWLKNRDKQNSKLVEVQSNLNKKEWIFMSVGFVIVTCCSYYLLKVLNTEQLIMSTLAFVSMLPGVYLLARRSKWNQVAFFINDIFVLCLWILLVLENNLSYVPVVICFVFQMLYDVYGIFEWTKLEKKQQKYSKH